MSGRDVIRIGTQLWPIARLAMLLIGSLLIGGVISLSTMQGNIWLGITVIGIACWLDGSLTSTSTRRKRTKETA